MDLVTVFLGGLGGAVVGSALTYLGAYLLDTRRSEESQRGAARVLYFEATSNAVYLEAMAKGQVPIRRIATKSWAGTASSVAGLLAASEFKVVARAYFSAEPASVNIEAMIEQGASSLEARRMWESDTRDFAAAADVLRKAAWTDKERKDLAR